jgi:hypothetical protein
MSEYTNNNTVMQYNKSNTDDSSTEEYNN